ncbi:MAG: Holliday junction resolvase RuvX [Lachnospiraceae bacterium]|nr:Holliday junction resolvase RuvX [Lachnospiraceae bacterium]
MRYMGLDYGSKTVGVALTDETGTIARGLETIRRPVEKRLRRTLARIEELIVLHNVGGLVVGLPLNMDGSEGERAEKVRVFADKLMRRTGLPLHFMDERLTTVEAYEILDSVDIRDEKSRQEKVDSIAAAVILEDFLNQSRKDSDPKWKKSASH